MKERGAVVDKEAEDLPVTEDRRDAVDFADPSTGHPAYRPVTARARHGRG